MKKVDVHSDPSLSKELVVGNKTFRSTCDFRLTERDLEKARKELKETEEKRRNCLLELKKLLSDDKRMIYRMDDDYLLRFLRFRKFDTEKAYKFIKRFYTMRNEDPLLFNFPPDVVKHKLKGKFNNVMPYTHDNGEMVFLHRLGHWNLSEVSVRDFCTIFSNASDVLTMNPHAQIDGVLVIFDFKGLSARMFSELLYPSTLNACLQFIQEVYPWRVKKIIIFNCSAVLYAGLYVIRSILKKKMADRIVLIHSDFEELHKHVNPEILPEEYGGKLDNEECSSYGKKVVLTNEDYITYENSFVGYKE